MSEKIKIFLGADNTKPDSLALAWPWFQSVRRDNFRPFWRLSALEGVFEGLNLHGQEVIVRGGLASVDVARATALLLDLGADSVSVDLPHCRSHSYDFFTTASSITRRRQDVLDALRPPFSTDPRLTFLTR